MSIKTYSKRVSSRLLNPDSDPQPHGLPQPDVERLTSRELELQTFSAAGCE